MADTDGYRPQRPRTSTMLSWGSHKSKESQPKIDMVETERDKAQRRITGKADPSVAINELQPADRNMEKNTIAPLRSMQFKDHRGDVITDPDRSNPTRPRMERPLDTIRSFEAAVDSGYSRRYSAHPEMQSRRSSFYQNPASPQPRNPAYDFNPANLERQPDSRPESVYDQQQGGNYGYGNGPPRRLPHGRMNSEPVYGSHPQARYGNQQSYDAATASSSGTYQTDQGNVSTDPSSYSGSNGELNQMGQYNKPQPPASRDNYGIDYAGRQEHPYGQPVTDHAQPAQSGQFSHASNGMLTRGNGYGNSADMAAPPPPPPHGNGARGALRKQPASNGNNAYANVGQRAGNTAAETPKADKRKSWLARRFSKQS